MNELIAIVLSWFIATTPVGSLYATPIAGFDTRTVIRGFGQKVVPMDKNILPCGAPFSGYHTGVDLEIDPSETNMAIPVYAISDGSVLTKEFAQGYGGVIVLKHPDFTSLYGHLDLSSSTLKKGDNVKRGEQLALLGDNCTSQTDGERKHLHFAIHNGSALELRGYIDSINELNQWLNPVETIKSRAN